jgi:thiosulfate dehydrogenase [quinone] large subunit
MSNGAAFALILLRTVIGWHFAYEGLYKLALPGWTRTGQPLRPWTAAGYLQHASGPLAPWFHWLGQPPAIQWIDVIVPVALVLVGLSMLLGALTRVGCWGALALLTLFYVSALPMHGVHAPGSEGAYLVVNKTLIEAAAVLVLLAFRTGEIAGIDLLISARRARPAASPEGRGVPAQRAGTATNGGLR